MKPVDEGCAAGRHQIGTAGEIISEWLGGIVGIRRVSIGAHDHWNAQPTGLTGPRAQSPPQQLFDQDAGELARPHDRLRRSSEKGYRLMPRCPVEDP